jgi:protein-S-isoprenylcysteine O-methyltransferase Ste14
MDPINILIAINVIATFGANFSGAKKGLKTSITKVKDKPKTYLQTVPTAIATLTLLLLIVSLFELGTLTYSEDNFNIRLIALLIYVIFSWIQIWSYRSLGDNYAQDIVILNNHKLVNIGPYKLIRHPQYLSQIIVDISGAVAVMSYLLAPIAIIEIYFFVNRAFVEEKLLHKHFKDDFVLYKKKSGFMFPFIG